MTSKLTSGPLFAQVHNVPDDYEFTDAELDRIIAGDMFTPRQAAIMARELKRKRACLDSEPVAWTDEQCLEFLSIAFRHAQIKGDLELEDIRKGIRIVNDGAAAENGNSPVIPDGWVLVPVEPTEGMLAAAKEWTGLTGTAEVIYREMIAAAPQEVTSARVHPARDDEAG